MIKTYITHGSKTYLVSTINRQSSCIDGGYYAETLVWQFDVNTNKRVSDSILMQESDSEDSIRQHLYVVEKIHEEGISE